VLPVAFILTSELVQNQLFRLFNHVLGEILVPECGCKFGQSLGFFHSIPPSRLRKMSEFPVREKLI
jgi:hypothetical protein